MGNPLRLLLTPGQWGDCPQALALLQGWSPQIVIADKGYDSNKLVKILATRQIQAVIPSKANRDDVRPYDQNLYADRNKVERFFNHLKAYRRIATRYDKTAVSFLAFVELAAALIWLR